MKVFIQTNRDGSFPNLNFFQANEGFKSLGYEIEYFYWKEDFPPNSNIHSLKSNDDIQLDKEVVVVGGVPVIDWVYESLDVKNPHLVDYPEQLTDFLDRHIQIRPIKEVRQLILNEVENGQLNSYFIKPTAINRKKFTGHVVSRYVDLIRTSGVSDNELVWFGPAIKIYSEYRVFVHHHEIVGMKNYNGDFMVFPDVSRIQRMVNLYSSAPVAYALDVGVTDNSTVLIEVNDANALGCYGLNPIRYATMIADRWNEVMTQ